MCIRDSINAEYGEAESRMSDDEVSDEKTKLFAEAQKAKGNAAFAKGDNKVALRHYTMAINLDPTNAVYYSNRSAAHAGSNDWSACLEDSHKTLELRPEWFKGYTRLAFGFSGLKMYKCALEQYELAAAFEDAPQSVHESLAKAAETAAKTSSTIEEEKQWLIDQQAEHNKRKMAEAGCSVM
eukprot:TRINITY_DN5201_c0_g1_i1.p1 TRINITY_DN5201_c0_g1~~TRINITY_DN5201_c0_g1_i1.p1  ORF type:complete len:182 (+),score=71.87 TRINITY_DN5201_c0_g1_i1:125-670(+)